jgi:TonB family protein
MIASWMSYAFLLGALVAIAAVVLERITVARRWPMRVVWAAALFLSIAWPVGSAARELLLERMKPVTVLPFTITVQPSRMISRQPIAPALSAIVDRALIVLWALMSVALFIRLLSGVLTLRRTRRDWARGEIDGTAVRLSDNVGPAVVGLRNMDVVVPEWIMTLDAPLRAIVLRHEEEHRAARDPYLLFFAAIGVALMPWNVPLWLQARRLRLAIEMDCDARVLLAHPSPERYGLLMLTIAQRRSVAPTLFAPMLSEPTTQLERRILAMRTTTRRLGRFTMYGGITVAIGVLAFACSLTSDNPAAADSNGRADASVSAVSAQVQTLPGSATPRYPAMLRLANVEGTVVAAFVVDANGAAEPTTFKVLKSSHDLFTNAVRVALPTMRFTPAVVNGRNVKQLAQMTFAFNLPTDSSATVRSSLATLRTVAPERKPANGAAVRAARPTYVGDDQTFFEYQVEQAARPAPDNAPPRYPDALRAGLVEGEVLAQFVVGVDGRADTSTVKILKSTHKLFTDAVVAALPRFRFLPARVGGKAVKQLVQMPFRFNLDK